MRFGVQVHLPALTDLGPRHIFYAILGTFTKTGTVSDSHAFSFKHFIFDIGCMGICRVARKSIGVSEGTRKSFEFVEG